MQILLFKTNLTGTTRVSDVEISLDMHTNITGRNVDLNDGNNILRIV